MGIRSFLIKFDSVEQIKHFYNYKKYIAYVVSNDIDRKYIMDEHKLNLFNGSKYAYSDYGDFDLELIGFKFWAGAIWGLVSTYTVGQECFQLYTDLFKNYATRLMLIPSHKIIYDEIEGIFMFSPDDMSEAINIFNRLHSKHSDELLNYHDIFDEYPEFYDLDCDNCISFGNPDMYEVFGIETKADGPRNCW